MFRLALAYVSRLAVSRLIDFSASFLDGEPAVEEGDVDAVDPATDLRLADRGSLLMRLLKNSERTLCSLCPPFRDGVPSAAAFAGVANGVEAGVLSGVELIDDREAARAGVIGTADSPDHED